MLSSLVNMAINHINLYIKFSKLIIKSRFQYRVDSVLRTLAVFCREAANIVIVYFTLLKFGELNGWTMKEMFFLFSLIFLSYSIMILLFTNIRDFDYLIHSGEFDRYLVRPRNLLFQVIASDSDYFAGIGHGAVGLVLFFSTTNSLGIEWNCRSIIYFLVTLLGGVAIQFSIFMFFACTSFWTIKSENLRYFIFNNTRKFAGYPISIYPAIIQKILIFVVPFAFVNYFPAQYFLRKPDMGLYWGGYIYLTPIVGILTVILVYVLWRVGLKHYSSTGN